MKVYLADLIHNVAPGGNVITGNLDSTVPLNIGSLGAYAKKVFGDEIELRLFKFGKELLDAIDSDTPDVLGVSNYAWNAELNTVIGGYVKRHYPGVLTVMGGPAIRTTSEDIEEFLRAREWIDAYVMYEGEGPFIDLLEYVAKNGPRLAGKDSSQLGNICYMDDGEFFYSAISATQLRNPDDFPSPYLTGLMDEFLDQGLIPLFETNRGCPFSCTFCDWGISSMNKVRRFSLDRVFAELEYVATRAPQSPAWIFADANFGILKRDVDIARKIKEVRQTTKLQTVITWDSKNTYERNSEIAQILGRYDRDQHIANTGMAYVAVQNLSPKVLKAIKRDNINLDDLFKIVKDYHRNGVKVTTDVLYCLPSETYEDAISTLRQCFDIHFDYINIQRTLMLPGSEMETSESRDGYGLNAKFMIRRGSYGDYPAKFETLRAMEFDEVIASSPTFTEEEALNYHVLQWLVFYSWNNGRLAPLFRYLLEKGGPNPVDVLLKVMSTSSKIVPRFANLLIDLKNDIRSIVFDTPEAMRSHYYQDKHWAALQSYIRVELRYNAMMFGDSELHKEFCDATEAVTVEMGLSDDLVVSDLISFIRANFVDLHSLARGGGNDGLRMEISGTALSNILFGQTIPIDRFRSYNIELIKSEQERQSIRNLLTKHGYEESSVGAIERLLGARYTSAVYDCRVSPSSEEQLITTS